MDTTAQGGVSDLAGGGTLTTEVGTIVIFLILAVWAVIDARRREELSMLALCGIGGLAISWQEFYADWGLYLLWSDKFHLLPWGSTLWTTPLKPAYVIPSYAVFMVAGFAPMLTLAKWMLRTFPRVHPFALCLFAALPLVLVNFSLELISVSYAGQWTYLNVIGPAIVTAEGQQPILFPNIPLGIFGAVTSYLILKLDAERRPAFEAITQPASAPPGWRREARRALAWMATWNLTYLLFLTAPVLAARLVWGAPNSIVP